MWQRPVVAVGATGGLFAGVFGARAAELVGGEAVDTLLALPVAVIGVAFGLGGGVVGGVLAALVFAAGETLDSHDPAAGEIALRAGAFSLLGAFVGGAAGVLARTRARFAGAFDSAPNGMLLTDASGRIAVVNDAAARLVARRRSDLVGRSIAELFHPDDAPVDETSWTDLLRGVIREYTVERRLLSADGVVVPVLISAARMPAPAERHPVVIHIVDVTHQRRSEERLAYLADHDPLTGLLNRRRFEQELTEHLARAARHSARGAVLLLDLDHFKYVNDTLGHAAGDVVLKAVGDALRSRMRAEDVLARLGGDEFALLLEDASDEAAVRSAEARVATALTTVSVPVTPGRVPPDARVHVTASIGATLVEPGVAGDALLAQADLAMYEAKETSRGRLVIHRPQGAHARQSRARFTWGERIRRALQDHQFVLYLQPIIPLQAGPDLHYEALLRLIGDDQVWEPATFLNHAERLGLMNDIDRYVVDHAAELLAALPADQHPRLEVNLSAASLADPDLADWVDDALRRHAIDPARLIFEITETMAIANIALADTSIRRLRAQGCGFALDDFGVGLSSFYYLRELPFDILKIDGTFIQDLPASRTNQLIVRAMINTAQGLGRATIAEFVGNAATVQALRDLGCDYGQGNYLGQPQPVGELFP